MSEASDGARDIGSLAEEATKLFGALSEWARDHAGEAGDGLSGLADQAAASAHDLNDHLAAGAAECTVCPICRTVRQLSPEVKTHLAAAASSLMQATASLLATPMSQQRDSKRDVEHIDLNDDGFEN